MLNHIKEAVSSMASGLFAILKGTLIRSLKIEAVKLYVRAVCVARNISIIALSSIASLLLAAIAFIMIHVGLLIVLPFSIEIKGWIILILGVIYGLISYTMIANMCSEKTWLEVSKASDLINEIVKKD